MINIIKCKKFIIIKSVYDNNQEIYNNEEVNNIQFTQEQLDFIKLKKVFLLYYQTDKLVSNIPNTITHIVFQRTHFNQDICKYLSNKISHIEFNHAFNQPVSNLPSSLINIQFGKTFNQNVSNLPNKLKRLQFGEDFNQPVNMLPESLEMLIFGLDFNQDVSNLPSSIKYIQFGQKFSQPIDNLPNSIQTIKFSLSNRKYQCVITKFPTNLIIIKLPWNFNPIDKINTLFPDCFEKIILSGTYYYANNDIVDKINKNFGLDKTQIILNNVYG